MDYLTVSEIAKRWGLSERSVRNYCNQGRVFGATLKGKTWMIPNDAIKPKRPSKKKSFLDILKEERKVKLKGGIYHKVQIELTYNSNHIEGSSLTYEQTRYIYETNTLGLVGEAVNVDDIVETANHFNCVDLIIDKANFNISEKLIKELHQILKSGTSASRESWFIVGDYKKLPNEAGGVKTTKPENVQKEIKVLLDWYNRLETKTIQDIIEFHYRFEIIHPFQDGNGRVGRLLMFKECLKHNIVPFIIDEALKMFYYRGLKEWKKEKGYLLDTCLSAQDKFKTYLDYFRIEYNK
ncbi:MAG: Fic family protein [Bacilli bacterium]|jgi:Fic family protein